MGVPRFFRNLLKKYRNTHFWDPNFVSDYFFMDYNAFLYKCISDLFKKLPYAEFKRMTFSQREDVIIDYIVKETISFSNNIGRPRKLLYLAFDGPAPRSKMKLQRERRYKSVSDKRYIEILKKKYNIKDDNYSLWSTSLFSPGTTTMFKLSKQLKIAAKKNKFRNIKVIISDTNIPGEGEHKILQYIKYLNNLTDKICIYSPDADMIILSLQYNGDIYNVRYKEDKKEDIALYPDAEVTHIFFSVKNYRKALLKEFGNFDEYKLSKDIIYITFFIGNDFVKHIPFLKSNKRGFYIILGIYKKLLRKYNNKYLVNEYKSTSGNVILVDKKFLLDIFSELSRIEDSRMKNQYEHILKKIEEEEKEKEEDISTYEEELSCFEHSEYYKKENPFCDKELFRIIDYSKPKHIWKHQYYSHFFNISYRDRKEYYDYINIICHEYIKSTIYCLRYYLCDIPSWDWYYPFRVAPFPYEIIKYLKSNNLNFEFEKGKPYYPMEQLTMILPREYSSFLPKELKRLLDNKTSELKPFFPDDFELDKLVGEKRIYSHPLLPPFIDSIVRPIIINTFDSFTEKEQQRNILTDIFFEHIPE